MTRPHLLQRFLRALWPGPPRRGDDELTTPVEQRVDDVIELELGLFAVHLGGWLARAV